jgi:hypothetical protein
MELFRCGWDACSNPRAREMGLLYEEDEGASVLGRLAGFGKYIRMFSPA